MNSGFSVAHVLYIPGLILVGAVIGFLLGTRSARQEADADRRRKERRRAARGG